MSNEENSKESVNESEKEKSSVSEVVEAVGEAVEDAVETVEEVVGDAVETVEEAVEDGVKAGSNVVAKIMELKDSNPKVFFGGIAGLVIIVLIMMMGGDGGSKRLPESKQVNLSIGQTYSLKGVNTYDPNATIRLVGIPGSIAAYDDSEDKGKDKCKHMTQGTKVKLLQTQEAFGKATFVEVEIMAGECAGRKGWVIANNLN